MDTVTTALTSARNAEVLHRTSAPGPSWRFFCTIKRFPFRARPSLEGECHYTETIFLNPALPKARHFHSFTCSLFPAIKKTPEGVFFIDVSGPDSIRMRSSVQRPRYHRGRHRMHRLCWKACQQSCSKRPVQRFSVRLHLHGLPRSERRLYCMHSRAGR